MVLITELLIWTTSDLLLYLKKHLDTLEKNGKKCKSVFFSTNYKILCLSNLHNERHTTSSNKIFSLGYSYTLRSIKLAINFISISMDTATTLHCLSNNSHDDINIFIIILWDRIILLTDMK